MIRKPAENNHEAFVESGVVLVINPGSTTTKLALFEAGRMTLFENIAHNRDKSFSKYVGPMESLNFRMKDVRSFLEGSGISIGMVGCIVCRGGLLRPLASGTYAVNARMLEDLRSARYGIHASNLGAIMASELCGLYGVEKPIFIVDPVVVDEMDDLSRISGLQSIERRSVFHALNQKAVARMASLSIGKRYEDSRLIVAHLGGGISVGAHCLGRVIDVNNALDGDGPFSPERSGALPVSSLVRMCMSERYSKPEMREKIVGRGGLSSYLGTSSLVEVNSMIAGSDRELAARASLVKDAMAYQIAREIGAMACVLSGRVDAIVLTGGMSSDIDLVESISGYVSFISGVMVFEGENEMKALYMGVRAVSSGESPLRQY
jgi:butyrate kinase